MTWENKSVCITGANRGIGLTLAKLLSVQKAKIIALVRRSSPELNDLDLNGGQIVEGVDVSSDDVKNVLERELAGIESIDYLINNSGLLSNQKIDDTEIDYAAMRLQYEVNSLGPLRVTHALLSKLKSGSKVFIISSLMGSIGDNGSGGHYGYRMSKTAVNMLAKCLSVDLKKRGVIVQPIHPGFVKTDMTAGFGGGMDPETSATMLIAVMEKASIENTGEFTSYKGHVDHW